MIMVWNGLLYAMLPFVLIRLYWRGRLNPKYRERWRERLGHVDSLVTAPVTYWVHAVSVGEVNAARPLIDALLSRNPDGRVLITSTTPTGSDQISSTFGGRVEHCYAPYDLMAFVERFLDHVRPEFCIIMETEIWPNTITACDARQIPVLMANARISDGSFIGYQRVRRYLAPILQRVTVFAAQSQRDAERLLTLGAPPERVHVTGSVKFDFSPPATEREIADALRADLGRDRPVFIAGSTREHEEERIIAAMDRILATVPNVLLLLVPRHPERFDIVASMVESGGYKLVRRTEGMGPIEPDVQVYLGDTMGELGVMYGAADVVFVGGSLVPAGGHNILEACAMERPVVFGPHTSNFREITEIVLAEEAGLRVNGVSELADTVVELLGDANRRYAMGEAGARLLTNNRGALERTLALLDNELTQSTKTSLVT